MVFNNAARALLCKTPPHVNIVSHDWWAYMLVTGSGGSIFYDAYPGVRYRQHNNNIAGQNITLFARLARLSWLLKGRFAQWNEINLIALDAVESCLTQKNCEVKNFFKKSRKGNLFTRLVSLYCSGIYRQTLSENIGLFIAAFLKKL